LDWADANTGHIVRHGVTPGEVEQELANDPLIVLAVPRLSGEERGAVCGADRRKPGVADRLYDAPVFRSEAEEATWWDQHQDLIADLLVKHGHRGTAPTKNISVRLPVTDLDRARRLAEKRGVGYGQAPFFLLTSAAACRIKLVG
jgi:hypothetical protein